MGRCAGACCGKITREEYLKIVDGVRKLLSGRGEELLRELREKMKAASDAQEFERAARLRDQILAIEEVSGEQRVQEFSEEDRDYIAHAPCGEALVIVVLQVREGQAPGQGGVPRGRLLPRRGSLVALHCALLLRAQSHSRRGVRVQRRGRGEPLRLPAASLPAARSP